MGGSGGYTTYSQQLWNIAYARVTDGQHLLSQGAVHPGGVCERRRISRESHRRVEEAENNGRAGRFLSVGRGWCLSVGHGWFSHRKTGSSEKRSKSCCGARPAFSCALSRARMRASCAA